MTSIMASPDDIECRALVDQSKPTNRSCFSTVSFKKPEVVAYQSTSPTISQPMLSKPSACFAVSPLHPTSNILNPILHITNPPTSNPSYINLLPLLEYSINTPCSLNHFPPYNTNSPPYPHLISSHLISSHENSSTSREKQCPHEATSTN